MWFTPLKGSTPRAFIEISDISGLTTSTFTVGLGAGGLGTLLGFFLFTFSCLIWGLGFSFAVFIFCFICCECFRSFTTGFLGLEAAVAAAILVMMVEWNPRDESILGMVICRCCSFSFLDRVLRSPDEKEDEQ